MKIIAISDTHLWDMPEHLMPEGDVLVHAGDATYRGTVEEVQQFRDDLIKHVTRYKHIVFAPGNHDWGFEKDEEKFRMLFAEYDNIHILINQEVVIDGIKFWGSPVCPPFGRWAFYRDDKGRKELWESIPKDTDVLITHGPPHGILDEVENYWDPRNIKNTGCDYLASKVLYVHPKLHIFGHIHEGYGYLDLYKTKFVNASIMDERYKPVNKPFVLEI